MATSQVFQGQIFSRFPAFPAEIRYLIWGYAANDSPRVLDIWSDFIRCEEDNLVFFTQVYNIPLSNTSPPAILHSCQEGRREALQYYQLLFETTFELGHKKIVRKPRWYINLGIDMLVPRGFWNLVSFSDFCARGPKRLAVDTAGSFYLDNLQAWAKGRSRVSGSKALLEGVDELVFYNSKRDEAWKEGRYLERFRKSVMLAKKDLNFEELNGSEIVDEKPLTINLTRAEALIRKALNGPINVEDSENDGKSGEDASEVVKADEKLRPMPEIKYMKLVMTERE